MIGIREVNVTHQVQQVVMTRIQAEVLEQQLGAYDTYGVVIETHADAVRNADQIGRINKHLAVHLRMSSGATNGDTTLAVTLKTYQLIGHETINQR